MASNYCPECERLALELAAMTSRYTRAAADIASLEAEFAEARKDADRLDWLSNCDTVKVWKKPNSGDPSIWFCHIDGDIRAAIDSGEDSGNG